MENKKAIGLILILTVVLLTITIIPAYPRFQDEMNTANERLIAGSKNVHTNHGLLEYGDEGEGYPVLIIHGVGGGYNQGLILGKALLGDEFRLIAPSRFGYLHTPIPVDATHSVQADTYADLLDYLDIEEVIVVGISSGGPSALQFALRYPERCTALVMVSAISQTGKAMNPFEWIIHNTLLKSDLIFWLVAKHFESMLIFFFGVPLEVQGELTPKDKAWISDVLIPSMHPISQRNAGMLNDAANYIRKYPIEQITVPTLVIHAQDDGLVPFSHGQYTADSIPNTKFVALLKGGHFLMGQHMSIRLQIENFLKPLIVSETILEGKWILRSFTIDGEEILFPEEKNITIRFDVKGKLSGSGGCNEFIGSYKIIYDNMISIGPIAFTEMTCPEGMEQEQLYFGSLEELSKFNLTDNELRLSSMNEQTVLIFSRQNL
jgi:pimeloyl-ACP methyl ester carboxylesterase/heat shock protein HslJ